MISSILDQPKIHRGELSWCASRHLAKSDLSTSKRLLDTCSWGKYPASLISLPPETRRIFIRRVSDLVWSPNTATVSRPRVQPERCWKTCGVYHHIFWFQFFMFSKKSTWITSLQRQNLPCWPSDVPTYSVRQWGLNKSLWHGYQNRKVTPG